MDFLGVGPLELIFIFILALIIFGPNDIVKAGRSLGRFMRKVITSDGWKVFQQTRKGMSNIPTMLMREAGLEEEELRKLSGYEDIENATKDIQNATRDIGNQISPWTTPPANPPNNPEKQGGESTIEKSSQPQTELAQPQPDQDMVAKPNKTTIPPPDSPFSQTTEEDKDEESV
jgi:Sec-independent protein translocase protein TatA